MILPLKLFLTNFPNISVSSNFPLNVFSWIILSEFPIVEFLKDPLNSLLVIEVPVIIIEYKSFAFLEFKSHIVLL